MPVHDDYVDQELPGLAEAKQAMAQLEAVSDNDEPTSELGRWWIGQARSELAGVIAKAENYGGADLELMGEAMLELLGWRDQPNGVGVEIACWFYALGKLARMMGAYTEHRMPDVDTIYDLRIYASMALKVRETGRWT